MSKEFSQPIRILHLASSLSTIGLAENKFAKSVKNISKLGTIYSFTSKLASDKEGAGSDKMRTSTGGTVLHQNLDLPYIWPHGRLSFIDMTYLEFSLLYVGQAIILTVAGKKCLFKAFI